MKIEDRERAAEAIAAILESVAPSSRSRGELLRCGHMIVAHVEEAPPLSPNERKLADAYEAHHAARASDRETFHN